MGVILVLLQEFLIFSIFFFPWGIFCLVWLYLLYICKLRKMCATCYVYILYALCALLMGETEYAINLYNFVSNLLVFFSHISQMFVTF